MVVSATTAPTTANASAVASTVANQATISGNFETFLQLLTTQLKNQNPLDPLDTNQFTQQLVQFAQVEQQMHMNSSLGTLISLQQANQATSALGFIGSTVVVNGDTTKLTGGQATWTYSIDRPAQATINVTDAKGQVVYTEARTLNPGTQSFTWNGRNANGQIQPDGDYTISITARDASGQAVAVSTEVEGTVDSVDVTQNPPVLNVGAKSFTLDKVKRVTRRAG
jgi:flagellar basal-body rod modification protein FlgD